MNNFNFKVIKHVADLSNPAEEYVKEVNIVDWCRILDEDGVPISVPKLDIRTWKHDKHTGEVRPQKGISLNRVQMQKLKEVLKNLDENEVDDRF